MTASAAEKSVLKFEDVLKVATSKTNSAEQVYLNETNQKWVKRKFEVSDLKYDVKKTNSLVSPIIANVIFSLKTEQTEFLSSKETTEASTTYEPKRKYDISFNLSYAYQNSRWNFLNAKYELKALNKGTVSTVSEEEIRKETNLMPAAVLKYWLPE